ncbi:MAG TPA: site-2 protease family protein [Persephonella sp.]|nr:site-2 protease family protein [Persephonella sp.]
MKIFKLTKIFGIDVKLDVSWFIIFFLLSYTFTFFYYPYCCPDTNLFIRIIFGVFFAIIWFLCILLHELGHSLIAKKFGFNVKEIILFVFGGVSVISHLPKKPYQEFLIAVAGPIISFILAILFFLLSLLTTEGSIFYGLLSSLAVGNFILGVFNLIPAFPLDGGRILRALFWNKFGEIKATKFALFAGKVFAYFMMITGGYYLIKGEFLNGIWLIVLGYFIKKSAENNYKHVIVKSLFENYKTEQFMHVVKPLFYNTKVSDVINYYFPFYKVKTLPVIGKDGKFYVIDIKDLYNVPENLEIGKFLKHIKCFVSPYDDIFSTYEKLKDCNVEEIPVIYKNTLLGIIKRSVVEDKIKELERLKEI